MGHALLPKDPDKYGGVELPIGNIQITAVLSNGKSCLLLSYDVNPHPTVVNNDVRHDYEVTEIEYDYGTLLQEKKHAVCHCKRKKKKKILNVGSDPPHTAGRHATPTLLTAIAA